MTAGCSGVFVNTLGATHSGSTSPRCSADLEGCADVLRLDGGTGGAVVRERLGRTRHVSTDTVWRW